MKAVGYAIEFTIYALLWSASVGAVACALAFLPIILFLPESATSWLEAIFIAAGSMFFLTLLGREMQGKRMLDGP